MSNQTLKSIAIAGVGRLGAFILKALAAQNPQPSIVVLTRQSARSDLPEGVKFATIDYEDQSSIVRALQEHKVEALLSVITTRQVPAQYPLIDAAKTAGVKIFAPSEYGPPSHGVTEGPFVAKAKLIEHMQSIGLPYTLLYSGCFLDNLPLVLALHTGKIHIVGEGKTPASFTARKDIGEFVAHALTTFPISKLENAMFRIEGQKATLQDVVKVLDKPVEYVDQVPANDPGLGGFLTNLHKEIEAGRITVFYDWKEKRNLSPDEVKDEVAKNLWPEYKWAQIGDAL